MNPRVEKIGEPADNAFDRACGIAYSLKQSEDEMETRPQAYVVPREGVETVSFHGLPTQHLVTGGMTDGQLCLTRTVSKKGGFTPAHRHGFSECFYLLSGGLHFRGGNAAADLFAGEAIHLPGGVPHQPLHLLEEDCEVLVICSPAGFDSFQKEAAGLGVEQFNEIARRYGIELPLGDDEFQATEPIHLARHGVDDRRVVAAGDLYRFLVTGKESDGAFALWHATVPPGGGPPAHIHRREIEIFYVLSGTIRFFDGETAVDATVGMTLVMPRGNQHRFVNQSDENAELLILISPAGLEEMFFEIGKPWKDGDPITPPGDHEKRLLAGLATSFGIELVH